MHLATINSNNMRKQSGKTSFINPGSLQLLFGPPPQSSEKAFYLSETVASLKLSKMRFQLRNNQVWGSHNEWSILKNFVQTLYEAHSRLYSQPIKIQYNGQQINSETRTRRLSEQVFNPCYFAAGSSHRAQNMYFYCTYIWTITILYFRI